MSIKKNFYLAVISLLFISCHQADITNASLSNSEMSNNNNSGVSKQKPLPDFQFDGGVHGCGNFFVYRTTKDETKAISVKVNKEVLKITDKAQTFEIEANDSLEIYIDNFGKDDYKNRINFCFDAIDTEKSESIRYPAVKGKATIYTSKSPEGYFYIATVILENVTFQTPDNRLFNIEKVEMKDVKVGFLVG